MTDTAEVAIGLGLADNLDMDSEAAELVVKKKKKDHKDSEHLVERGIAGPMPAEVHSLDALAVMVHGHMEHLKEVPEGHSLIVVEQKEEVAAGWADGELHLDVQKWFQTPCFDHLQAGREDP